MRINKFLAHNAGLSRRKADTAIINRRVTINNRLAVPGDTVEDNDYVTLDEKPIAHHDIAYRVVALHKPVGYVCSRNGQGSPTIYSLLPPNMHDLNVAGRLDKDSSGLVILTNDGELLYDLTHPTSKKFKIYEVSLNSDVSPEQQRRLLGGVDIGDVRLSRFTSLSRIGNKKYKVTLEEGRNRQIRRSFSALHKEVVLLKRVAMGGYTLSHLAEGKWKETSR